MATVPFGGFRANRSETMPTDSLPLTTLSMVDVLDITLTAVRS